MRQTATSSTKLTLANQLTALGARAVTTSAITGVRPSDARQLLTDTFERPSHSGRTPTEPQWFLATQQRRKHAAKQSLANLCVGKAAGFFQGAADEKGRVVWVVTCNGVNVNREQVRRGLARVNQHRNTDPELPGLEAAARWAKLGMWADIHRPLGGVCTCP